MARRNQANRLRSLSFESLEHRIALAGDVTVTNGIVFSRPTINLVGDQLNKNVAILPGNGLNIYRIVGLPDAADNTATTVNGLNEVCVLI